MKISFNSAKLTKKFVVLVVMTILLGSGAYKVWALQKVEDAQESSQAGSQASFQAGSQASSQANVAVQNSKSRIHPEVLGAESFGPQFLSSSLWSSSKIHGAVPVLMYHYIGDLPQNADQIRSDLTVSSQNFNAQISELQARGYHTISSEQLYANLAEHTSLPPKPIIISFDDGYQDTFKNAIPILLAHHMIGMFAIITAAVGQPNYASWPEIISAKTQGMDIVSHTVDHVNLASSKYTQSDILKEITKSRDVIARHLGVAPSTMIYPYGGYNSEIENMLQQSGYNLAFTTAYGFAGSGQDLLALPRVRVHGPEIMKKFEIDLGILPFTRSTVSIANVNSGNTVKTP